MGAMKTYFTYKMFIECGIPEITLEGTLEDWLEIKRRIQKFRKYNQDDLT